MGGDGGGTARTWMATALRWGLGSTKTTTRWGTTRRRVWCRRRARMRPDAVWRRGRSRGGGRCPRSSSCSTSWLRKKINHGHESVPKMEGEKKRAKGGSGDLWFCRNRRKAAAAELNSGEQNGRPDGVIWRGKRGERERRSRASKGRGRRGKWCP